MLIIERFGCASEMGSLSFCEKKFLRKFNFKLKCDFQLMIKFYVQFYSILCFQNLHDLL